VKKRCFPKSEVLASQSRDTEIEDEMACKSFLIALLAWAFSPAYVQAADEDRTVIVVEGSRLKTPTAVINSVTQLNIAIPTNALEIVEELPDVRATSTGGPGGSSFVSIRGAEPNFAQITIDGVLVSNSSSSQGGGFDFAQIDPSIIESVTIVPSSSSAVYGSDALSGVIAIRLSLPSQGSIAAGGAVISDDRGAKAANARLNYGWDDGGALLTFSSSETGDFAEGSTIDRRQALMRVTQDIGSWTLSGFAIFGDSNRSGFPESSGGPLLAANRAVERRETRFLATGFSFGAPSQDAIRPSLRIGYYDDNVHADTPAIFPGVFSAVPGLTSDTDYDRLQVASDVRFRLSNTLDLLVGTDFQRESATSNGTIDFGFKLPTFFAIQRKQLSGFVEAAWRPSPDLKLSLAGRTDWLRDSAESTMQASIEYRPMKNRVTLFAGFGEGFRLPSLFALAFPLTANPNLKPERSLSWEGGARWETGTSKVRASLFLNDYTNLIDFDPVLFTTVNRSETRIMGASISAEGKIGPRVEWNGSFTLLDFNSEVPLRSRPDRFGHARLTWQPIETLRIGGAATFNSDYVETSVPTGIVTLDGHVTFELFADWRASEILMLSLAVHNLGDTKWQDSVGFPAPGRMLRARIGFNY
jgi:vitamin B12 transporter